LTNSAKSHVIRKDNYSMYLLRGTFIIAPKTPSVKKESKLEHCQIHVHVTANSRNQSCVHGMDCECNSRKKNYKNDKRSYIMSMVSDKLLGIPAKQNVYRSTRKVIKKNNKLLAQHNRVSRNVKCLFITKKSSVQDCKAYPCERKENGKLGNMEAFVLPFTLPAEYDL
jgi:hypothetical protein